MEGYEAEFVGEVPSDMECGICLFVVREPVQIMACGHRFCSNCFDKLKKSGGRLRCPKDMDSIDLEKVFLDKAAQRAVANLMVKCFKTSKGCTWQGCLQELEKHGENCLFNDNHSLTNQEHIFNQLSNLEEAIKKKDYDLLNLKNENFRLEQEFIKYKNETTSFINNINTTLNNLLTSHHGLAARLQRLEELKEDVQKLEVKKKVNNLPLIPQNPKPNFIWKINRRSGSRQTSPSFYSADKGYLCQLKARKSLHLSLNILKGEHDERLKWPFNMRVEFVSFNKYSSQKHSLVYPLQKKTEKLSPLAHASYEYAVFLTPAVLNSCLVDDVVTVECYITDIAR